MNDETATNIEELERELGYFFRDPRLLVNACTHRSYTNENPFAPLPDNERLEFLGDAVLQLGVSDLLMARFPNFTEGQLSKIRAAVVNEQSLAGLARKFALGRHLLLGKGEEASGGRDKPSLLADTLEAIIAAVYLDGGYEQAARLIGTFFSPLITAGKGKSPHFQDYKSALQEYCQNRFHEPPRYVLLAETGPDHDKTFTVELRVSETAMSAGTGKSRKEAEQQAAKQAWQLFHPGNEQ